jgi:hypothetical protein
MKKIRLNVADLDATEILSRDQLKAIFGGSTGSSGSGSNSGGCGIYHCLGPCIVNDTQGYCGYDAATQCICFALT